MKKGGFLLLLIFSFIDLSAQKNSRFTAEINYGIQGNFFVRSYNEADGPQPSTEFSNKNFIGSIGGLTIKYRATKMAFWGFGYSQSTNKRIINYNTNISGVRLFISDFQISHINHFFEGFYQRNVSKKIANIKSLLSD